MIAKTVFYLQIIGMLRKKTLLLHFYHWNFVLLYYLSLIFLACIQNLKGLHESICSGSNLVIWKLYRKDTTCRNLFFWFCRLWFGRTLLLDSYIYIQFIYLNFICVSTIVLLLQRLDLRDNNIEVEGLKSLKESISKNSKITRLDLDPLPRINYSAVRYCFM